MRVDARAYATGMALKPCRNLWTQEAANRFIGIRRSIQTPPFTQPGKLQQLDQYTCHQLHYLPRLLPHLTSALESLSHVHFARKRQRHAR